MSDISNAIVKRDDKKIASKSARKSNNAPKTRPAFVAKIWSMVNDPANNDHIRWSEDGESFKVIGREQFERLVLPKYFKHSNFASFVRQLNMYGWHKVQDVTSGAMQQSAEEIWQFKSPNFIRDREDLLDNIVRNKSGKGGSDDEHEAMDSKLIWSEVSQIRKNQEAINEYLRRIQKDNELLWQENIESRERHKKHAATLDRIMRFLASLYGGNNKFLAEMMNNRVGQPQQQSQRMIEANPVAQGRQISELKDGSDDLSDVLSNAGTTIGGAGESPARKQRRIQSISDISNNNNNNNNSNNNDDDNDNDGTNNAVILRTPQSQSQPQPQVQIPNSPYGSYFPSMSPGATNSPMTDMATGPGWNSNYVETPSAFFPELKDDSSKNDLEENDKVGQQLQNNDSQLADLEKSLNEQGNNLQQVEQWLRSAQPVFDSEPPVNYDSFDVDDYLDPTSYGNSNGDNNGGAADPADPSPPADQSPGGLKRRRDE